MFPARAVSVVFSNALSLEPKRLGSRPFRYAVGPTLNPINSLQSYAADLA